MRFVPPFSGIFDIDNYQQFIGPYEKLGHVLRKSYRVHVLPWLLMCLWGTTASMNTVVFFTLETLFVAKFELDDALSKDEHYVEVSSEREVG